MMHKNEEMATRESIKSRERKAVADDTECRPHRGMEWVVLLAGLVGLAAATLSCSSSSSSSSEIPPSPPIPASSQPPASPAASHQPVESKGAFAKRAATQHESARLLSLGYVGQGNSPAKLAAGTAYGVPGGVAGGVEGGTLGGVPGGVVGPRMREGSAQTTADESAGTDTEAYSLIVENPFLAVAVNPLSTFSVDVDRAAYSNVRRFINEGRMPPRDAVRIEELINYFTYDYPEPTGPQPFSVTTEVSSAPWNPRHELVRIGLKGRSIETGEMPPSNLVFLIDVSGSMDQPNKLPLLKSAFGLLVNELRAEDRVAIVVYAGSAGLVLPSTAGSEKDRIMDSLASLEAGGSTAGGEGIKLAYEVAAKSHIAGGNNRVILATDGDFNVGVSSDAEMVRLIEEKRKQGTFLTVLGFGEGNLKDSKMEQIADKGNGHYSYIDTLMEARKVLVSELGGTLVTIAKDVKLQVEMNPARVQAYRLIGYENRLLRHEDFNDDAKDAGDIGAGHTVTALYEIIPSGIESDVPVRGLDKMRYRKTEPVSEAADSPELLFVRLRYKDPDGETSRLIEHPVLDQPAPASRDFLFASAVAELGLLLRDSEFKGKATFDDVIAMASRAVGRDEAGYRAEFLHLVESARRLGAMKLEAAK